jgi:MoxR-like ATPase
MAMLDVHLGARPPVEALTPVIDRDTFLAWQSLATRVFLSTEVKRYLVNLAGAMRSDARVLAPPSPRAMIMLARVAQAHALTKGRDFATPEDVRALAPEVLAHRMVIAGDEVGIAYVQGVLERVPLA